MADISNYSYEDFCKALYGCKTANDVRSMVHDDYKVDLPKGKTREETLRAAYEILTGKTAADASAEPDAAKAKGEPDAAKAKPRLGETSLAPPPPPPLLSGLGGEANVPPKLESKAPAPSGKGMTTLKVRTVRALPIRHRAGLVITPEWLEAEVNGDQLAQLQADEQLQIKYD
jgi:hypothetical protein